MGTHIHTIAIPVESANKAFRGNEIFAVDKANVDNAGDKEFA